MTLKEYKRKRHFRRTPEPEGDGAPAPGRVFVVQKHAARRLHYDFRLELDGTLKSWAIPKGPSLNPDVKALAVHVEDHPLEYAKFEGVIPKGEYGGGTVMVWDHGMWDPDGDANKGYREGKLKFRLHGEKLSGAWSLVKMSGNAGEGGKNWLLIKKDDSEARTRKNVLEAEPKSVLSDRAMHEIADDADSVWQPNGAASKRSGGKKRRTATKAKGSTKSTSAQKVSQLERAKKAKLPANFKPQLATLSDQVPAGDNWLHELKFDGYRLLAFCDSDRIRLITRNGNDWTKRFKSIARALADLPVAPAILDGEIVSLNEDGQSDFQRLQNLLKRGNDDELVYYLFDAPFLQGYNLVQAPLLDRKRQLAKAVLNASPENDGCLRYSDHIRGQGKDVLAHACRYAMEGVVSKLADSVYEQTRARSWLKVKCLKRQEFVLGGYTKPSGSRVGFGALLLGYYKDEALRYAGRVGTGFTHDTLRQMLAELKERRVESPPFANPPRGSQARGVTWVRPELVGEVEFTDWTDDGLLRHPSFQGLREDKPPEQIVREVPDAKAQKNQADANGRADQRKHEATKVTNKSDSATFAGVALSHPDRILYPEQGVTKRELAEFYAKIADWILPHIVDRPLTLVRCPRGRGKQCFYQKHLTESLPDHLRGVTIQERGKRDEYIVVDDLGGLISLVQMSVLEMHPWPALADDIERPTRIVFDLDPGPGVVWSDVIIAAREVRECVKQHNLASFVLASGGKGLHVIIPLKPVAKWDEVKAFAKSIAQQLASKAPKRYVATASKAKRKRKIFIDYLRNSRGATSVAPYSTRARAAAPLATPLRWDELGKLQAANQYTVSNIRRRLAALNRDPWDDYFATNQSI